jgi:arylsulfatase A-like enzyme
MAGFGSAAMVAPKLLFAAKRSGRQPNFVFFLIDDMGFKDIGCNGSTFYETPNIDKLAKDGMRFTDAYAACPVCSPTRASIMTGKYPARLNLTDYLVGRRRGKLIPPEYIHQMPLEEVTIAESLKEAGYATCFIGKWHLGDKPYWPEHQGFDINIGGTRSGMPRNYFWPKWRGNPPIQGRRGPEVSRRQKRQAVSLVPFALCSTYPAAGKKGYDRKIQGKGRQAAG